MRPLAGLAVLALSFALAGCAGEAPPTDDPVIDAAPGGSGQDGGHFEGTFALAHSEVRSPVLLTGALAGNCVMLDDDAVVSGTITVTWDASPTTPEMELVLEGLDEMLVATGQGAITLDVDAVRVAADRYGGSAVAWQVAQGAALGAAADLQGTLTLALDYVLADPSAAFEPDDGWTCSIGH